MLTDFYFTCPVDFFNFIPNLFQSWILKSFCDKSSPSLCLCLFLLGQPYLAYFNLLGFAFLSLFLCFIISHSSIFSDQAFCLLWSLFSTPLDPSWWNTLAHGLIRPQTQSKKWCWCLGSLKDSNDFYTWKITKWLKKGQSPSLSSMREGWWWVMTGVRLPELAALLQPNRNPAHVWEMLGCGAGKF